MFWAPITWFFIHSFSYKINGEYYKYNKGVPCNIIIYICNNLPCPMCRGHASSYLKNNNIKLCNTKEEFIRYLWSFHNNVNSRLNKPIFYFEKCNELFSRCNFINICQLFLKEFQRPYYYGRTLDSWQRKNVSKKINTYFIHNWKYYI